MNPDKNSPINAASVDDSLVRGGPFYRAQHAIGLIRPNQWNLGRRIALLLAIGWLPLFFITAISNPEGLFSLLKDYRVHSRMLIAVPALLIGESFIDTRFRTVFAHLRTVGLLGSSDLTRLDDVIARLVRLRDSLVNQAGRLAVSPSPGS